MTNTTHTVITWATTKIAGGYRFRVYSFGHEIAQVELKTGECATRAQAMGHAKRWCRYFQNSAICDVMTPTQYRIAIERLDLSQRKAGTFLGVNERQSRRWAAGDAKIPTAVGKLLRLMIKSGFTFQIVDDINSLMS